MYWKLTDIIHKGNDLDSYDDNSYYYIIESL